MRSEAVSRVCFSTPPFLWCAEAHPTRSALRSAALGAQRGENEKSLQRRIISSISAQNRGFIRTCCAIGNPGAQRARYMWRGVVLFDNRIAQHVRTCPKMSEL